MSTETHNSHRAGDAPFHESVTFEPRDINVGTVVKQLIYLAITIVISLLICIPVLKVLTGIAVDNDSPMPPVRAEMNQSERDRMSLPPEPRLQGVPGHVNDAQQDLRDKVAADEQVNESTGWVDKSKGIAKIPVSEAMKVLADKGGSVSWNNEAAGNASVNAASPKEKKK